MRSTIRKAETWEYAPVEGKIHLTEVQSEWLVFGKFASEDRATSGAYLNIIHFHQGEDEGKLAWMALAHSTACANCGKKVPDEVLTIAQLLKE